MYGKWKILAVIPARGGSKGVAKKNVRMAGGKPLIAWTIDEARKSSYLDRIIVSSEDAEILQIARDFGAETPFIRPIELAQDETPGIDPVLHALSELPGYDYVMLLQPTSPMRLAEDIDSCLQMCLKNHSEVCMSVAEAEKSPYWMFSLAANGYLKPIMGEVPAFRRQDLPQIYAINGAIYVAQTEWLLRERTFISPKTLAYIMPTHRSLDIDTELDFKLLECLISEANHEKK